MPSLKQVRITQRASRDLITALANPSPVAPFATLGQYQLRAIHQIATIFDSAAGTLSPLAVPLDSPAPCALSEGAPRQNTVRFLSAPVPRRPDANPNISSEGGSNTYHPRHG